MGEAGGTDSMEEVGTAVGSWVTGWDKMLCPSLGIDSPLERTLAIRLETRLSS